MHIRNKKDFFAGLMFGAFGLFFAGFGTRYTFGSAAHMGPGYFPTVLGCILMMLGLIVAVGALSAKAAEEKIDRFSWSTLFFVLGPIVLFGLLLNTLGLILCLLMLIGVSSYASHEFSWKATLGNAAVLITLCMVVFVYALKLQFPLWPVFIGAQG
jgi:uncharacterized membrane protein HdeD (DUF308 family)